MLALLATAALQAQVTPLDVNLFAEDFPPPTRTARPKQTAAKESEPAPADAQTLHFHNGRRLRGELAEVTPDEIVWRRTDASEALRFPRGEVRRIALAAEPAANAFVVRTREAETKDGPLPATLKLPGRDWLRGVVTSTDGQTFSLAVKEGAALTIPRAQIQWLHFGRSLAPAFGFGAGATALEGWLSGGSPRVEMKEGTMTVHDTHWIGQNLPNATRFEVAFEVPEESEEGLRLWLQPFNPQPNSYGQGMVQFQFGRKELGWLVYFDDMERQKLALSAEAQAEKGPVHYRILYDGLGQRVIVLRNAREIGNFSLKRKDAPAGADTNVRLPRGLCFDHYEEGGEGKLQFRSLSVRPWNGVIPAAGEKAAANQDRLSTPDEPVQSGALGAVLEKEITFAGKAVALKPNTFAEFPQTSVPLDDADALLSFGDQGEVSLSELRIQEGKVRGRAVFAPELELATSALKWIAFPPHAKTEPPVGDHLVFKNGDELYGALVSTATGAPLRWRLPTGQEIEFQSARVAGVRLTGGTEVKPAGFVELRSGERLRGTVAEFDERQVRWRHALLGEITLERQHLWRLYPNPAQALHDGSHDPDRWLRDNAKAKRMINYSRVRPQRDAWLALDGRFILRTREGNSGEQTFGPSFDLPAGLDRFELRVNLAAPSGNAGNLNIGMTAANEGALSLNLSAYSLYLYLRTSKSANGMVNRELPIREKIGQNARMLCLRAFVDRPAGTVDLFVNGHAVGRVGQSAAERIPGLGRSVTLDAYTYSRSPTLLTDVTVGPWSGELPRFGRDEPMTALANGDAVAGTPVALIDGRWRVESELGPLDFPLDKLQVLEFGGAMQPASAAGRLRLSDGSALLVEHFTWTGGECTARHATFGELRLPASSVRELIFDPAPVRPPMLAEPKKLAGKADAPAVVP